LGKRLERTSFEVNAQPGVIRPAGSNRGFLVWSVRDLRGPAEREVLELVDAASGTTVERSAARSSRLLRSETARFVWQRTVTNTPSSDHSRRAWVRSKTRLDADRWFGVERLGRQAYVDDPRMTVSSALYSH